MSVGTQFAASILAGLAKPGGSGRYLGEKRDSRQTLHGAVHHRITTVHEKLNLQSNGLKDCLALSALRSSHATHVVLEIIWGSQCVVTINHQVFGPSKPGDGKQLQAQVENFKAAVELDQPPNNQRGPATPADKKKSLEITAFSDILPNDIMMGDFSDAYEFLSLMPAYIRDENGGKGRPITYKLLPIEMLAVFLPIEINEDITATFPGDEVLTKFVHLLDDFSVNRQALSDYATYVKMEAAYMPHGHAEYVASRIERVKTSEESLKSRYAQLLQDVRRGRSDPNLWQLLREFAQGEASPKSIGCVEDNQHEKVEFVKKMVSKGALYIGHNGLDLNSQLAKRTASNVYVLSFSSQA